MKNTRFFKKTVSFLIVLVLITAVALSAVGCKDNKKVELKTPETESVSKGDGQTTFEFGVVFADGSEKRYTVKTDEKTVGAALLKEGLIEGEDGDYGLYVKTVGGVTADYDTDGTYWAFYVNGEYASSGVDSTEIKSGETYVFKIEK